MKIKNEDIKINKMGMSIKGCSCAICQCNASLGVPKKYLSNQLQDFQLKCPNCGFELTLYASLKSCN